MSFLPIVDRHKFRSTNLTRHIRQFKSCIYTLAHARKTLWYSTCKCVHTHIYIYMCVYIHKYIYTCVCMCVCMYVCMYVCMHTCNVLHSLSICIHVYTYIRCICGYTMYTIYICIHVYICIYMIYMYGMPLLLSSCSFFENKPALCLFSAFAARGDLFLAPVSRF